MKKARISIGAAFIVGAALSVSASPALAASFKVAPSGQDYTSIQAAVDAASAGDTILVYPGEYQEPVGGIAAVTINKPLKMKAKVKKSDPASVVKIIPNTGQNHGILIEGTEMAHIDGFQMKGFTVQGFPKNGIWLRYVDNFKLDSNTSIDNLENGIWPTLSANGLVKKNTSYGSDDSALWVEASTNVRVQQNELYDSVTGLEVTISSGVEMSKNLVHDNTVGVGLYHPNGAGMDIPDGMVIGNWTLSKNHIYNNNRANSAPPASLSGSLPPGGGVLVLGIDGLTADSNLIENNDFYGVSVIDYCMAVDGGGNDCSLVPPLVDSMPENNIFSNNELLNNGTNPVAHPLAGYAADVTAILVDLETPPAYQKPSYGVNIFCGTTPSTFTKDGVGSPLYVTKC